MTRNEMRSTVLLKMKVFKLKQALFVKNERYS